MNVNQKLLSEAPPGMDPLAPRPGEKSRSEIRRPSEQFREGYDKIAWVQPERE